MPKCGPTNFFLKPYISTWFKLKIKINRVISVNFHHSDGVISVLSVNYHPSDGVLKSLVLITIPPVEYLVS